MKLQYQSQARMPLPISE